MRMFEIASAEDQVALWKLISTSVWTAIEQQLQQQQRERAAQAKRPSAKGKTALARVAAKPLPPTKPQPAPLAPTATAAVNSADDAAAVGNAGAVMQPTKKSAARAEKLNADDTESSVDTVLSMREKLR